MRWWGGLTGQDGSKDPSEQCTALSGWESRIWAGDWQWEERESKSRPFTFSGLCYKASGCDILEIGDSGR